MTTQKMLSELRKTTNVFGMIKDGDRIAVGLSGGKDSLAMLYLLHRYAMFSPQRYSLVAITIDMGLGSDFSGLTSFCKSINTEHVIVATEIGKIVFDERKEKNPCSLCANMRRGALVNSASELKCNKLALGHNADDLIETFFLSMSFEGRLSALPPVTYLGDKNISIIRPLILTFEKNVAAYATRFPILKNPCPVAHHTNREGIKKLLSAVGKDVPSLKQRILSAIVSPDRYNLYDRYEIFDKFGNAVNREQT